MIRTPPGSDREYQDIHRTTLQSCVGPDFQCNGRPKLSSQNPLELFIEVGYDPNLANQGKKVTKTPKNDAFETNLFDF